MRSIEWLYEQLGKAYADLAIMREEYAKLQTQFKDLQSKQAIPAPPVEPPPTQE